jgi:hypothetical protein
MRRLVFGAVIGAVVFSVSSCGSGGSEFEKELKKTEGVGSPVKYDEKAAKTGSKDYGRTGGASASSAGSKDYGRTGGANASSAGPNPGETKKDTPTPTEP